MTRITTTASLFIVTTTAVVLSSMAVPSTSAFVIQGSTVSYFPSIRANRRGKELFVVAEPPQENKIPKKNKNNNNNRGKPEKVQTLEDYKSVVADEKDQLVAVRFYAPWCRSCKESEKYFRQLCRDHPNVKFVEVPTTKDNAFLTKGLGVESFPFGHIYHPDVGLVEELKINKHVFGDFQRQLKYYVDGQGDVEYPEEGLCEPAGCRLPE